MPTRSPPRRPAAPPGGPSSGDAVPGGDPQAQDGLAAGLSARHVFRIIQGTFTEEDLRTGIAHAEYQAAFEAGHYDPETLDGLPLVRR